MERWQLIERYVLLVVGVLLLGVVGWLAFFRSGVGRLAALALLAPCTFWVFWQALYEDKLGSAEPPSTGERVMYGMWVWARRIFLGAIAISFAVPSVATMTWATTLHHDGLAALLAFLSWIVGWVAMFGSGKQKSMLDDRAVHRERTQRYK